MKKNLFILLIVAIFMASCNSAKYYYKNGEYHMATIEAVKKIRKKPTHEKAIEVLKKSYPLANDIELSRIKFLKQQGTPDVWDEVFVLYSRLKDRQDFVKTVLPVQYPGGTINFTMVDYDQEILNAKKNAAEYFYAHGQQLLEKNDRFAAREAFYEFQQVKRYYKDYRDVDKLMLQAREMGISHVFVTVEDNTIFKLPNSFKKSLVPQDLTPLNTEWVMFGDEPKDKFYHYRTSIKLNNIVISPAQVSEKQYTETKEIQDGWDYVLDANGNVMKDSLGNDLKTPKIKTISCIVTETSQRREVSLAGVVTYTDITTNQVIKEVPIIAEHFFENIWALANGDFAALPDRVLELMKNKPISIPLDFDMIFAAGDVLKGVVKQALLDHRRVPR
ncbi:MAG: hypothetical protein JXR58_11100 [Bacteroidales bacterium]|nr:hypothetical protein [Bacteroidales bacterium]